MTKKLEAFIMKYGTHGMAILIESLVEHPDNSEIRDEYNSAMAMFQEALMAEVVATNQKA